MTRSFQRAAAAAGTPDDLEAAFYDALQSGDLERVMACWADEDEIVCMRPGGVRVVGPAAIRSAFTALLEHGGLDVRLARVARVQALASSVHSVVEQLRVTLPDGRRDAVIYATNVYHKTPQGWRLVAHHASVGGMHDADMPTPGGQVLH
ncbi:YybH family protein [Diaphorobacter sp.]|uniref:YybH family protein n=1 Tax=Diaphorobacter sp. TaxID=1934310 RepID=UPI003D0B4EFA